MSKAKSRWQHSVEIEIPFHDVDVMGIAWHGHYAKYFEIARCALLDTIDYNYPQMKASGYAWPVIDMHIRYVQPLLFQQTVRVDCWIDEYEYRLKINYLVSDAASGRRLTKGHTMQVAVNMKTEELCLASPAVLLEKLGVTE
ncbi:MAG TPA: acyl-CoA thioesterase [Pseudomonadales bacterium]